MSVALGSNNRRFERMDCDFPVKVDASGKFCEARAINVSLNGCQIDGVFKARVGETLTITYQRTGASDTFRAKVLMMTPKGEGFHYGCNFWAIDEDAKNQLVRNLIQMATLHPPMPPLAQPAAPEVAPAPSEVATLKTP